MIKDIREISRERLERTFMTNIVGMITIIQVRPTHACKLEPIAYHVTCLQPYHPVVQLTGRRNAIYR
jgi:hypothetical protein